MTPALAADSNDCAAGLVATNALFQVLLCKPMAWLPPPMPTPAANMAEATMLPTFGGDPVFISLTENITAVVVCSLELIISIEMIVTATRELAERLRRTYAPRPKRKRRSKSSNGSTRRLPALRACRR